MPPRQQQPISWSLEGSSTIHSPCFRLSLRRVCRCPLQYREDEGIANVLIEEQYGFAVSHGRSLATRGLDTRSRENTGSLARNRYRAFLWCTRTSNRGSAVDNQAVQVATVRASGRSGRGTTCGCLKKMCSVSLVHSLLDGGETSSSTSKVRC